MTGRRLFCFYVSLVSILLGVGLKPARVSGQVITGTILGEISDASKAVVPGATVTVTSVTTNVKITSVVTGSAGEYEASLVPIGDYQVTAYKEGFKTSLSEIIRVTAGTSIRVNLRLEVGAKAETVEVKGVSPLLQVDSSQVSNGLNAREIQDLPIPGRDILRLVDLGPGAVQGQTSNIALLSNTYLGSNMPDIAGGRVESTSFTYGGLNVDNRRVNMPMEKPSLDTVEEFQVLVNDYTAEYGQGDGQVIVEFRSGTNQVPRFSI